MYFAWSAPSVHMQTVLLITSPEISFKLQNAHRSLYCSTKCRLYNFSAPKRSSIETSLFWNLLWHPVCIMSQQENKFCLETHHFILPQEYAALTKMGLYQLNPSCWDLSSWHTSHCEKEDLSLNFRTVVHFWFQRLRKVPYLTAKPKFKTRWTLRYNVGAQMTQYIKTKTI